MPSRSRARAPMTGLQQVAMGLVLTIVDPEIAGYDAVPDVLGWLLVLSGLRVLRDRIAVATLIGLALLAGTVSLGLIRFAWLEALPESAGWGLSLPQFAFSVVLCEKVATVLGPPLHRRLRALRWAFLVAAAGPVLLYGGGLGVLLVPLAVLAVFVNLYLVYLLFRASAQVHGAPRTR
jgi:hypothetical protein